MLTRKLGSKVTFSVTVIVDHAEKLSRFSIKRESLNIKSTKGCK